MREVEDADEGVRWLYLDAVNEDEIPVVSLSCEARENALTLSFGLLIIEKIVCKS